MHVYFSKLILLLSRTPAYLIGHPRPEVRLGTADGRAHGSGVMHGEHAASMLAAGRRQTPGGMMEVLPLPQNSTSKRHLEEQCKIDEVGSEPMQVPREHTCQRHKHTSLICMSDKEALKEHPRTTQRQQYSDVRATANNQKENSSTNTGANQNQSYDVDGGQEPEDARGPLGAITAERGSFC